MFKAILIMLFIGTYLFSKTIDLPTSIQQDTSFSDTIIIKENTYIGSNASLTLLPGTVLLGENSGRIICTTGTIIAEGTADNKIIMSPIDTSLGWGGLSIDDSTIGNISKFDNVEFSGASGVGIYLLNRSSMTIKNSKIENNGRDGLFLADATLYIEDSEILNHDNGCGIISFANTEERCTLTVRHSRISENNGGRYGGAISTSNTHLTIINSSLDNNIAEIGGALSIFGASLFIDSSSISSNKATLDGGGAIYITADASLKLLTTSFGNNTSITEGGALNLFLTPTYINNCVFFGNTAPNGGAIKSNSSNIKIEKSSFCKNNADSGSCLSILCDTLDIKNSEFIQNRGSEAVYFSTIDNYQNASLTNCTIADNKSGISFPDNYPISIINTILWRNEEGSFPKGNSPDVSLNNYLQEENFAAPIFNDTSIYYYDLLETSPCIDKGTSDTTGLNIGFYDRKNLDRISNGRIDIGAHEYQYPTVINDQIVLNKSNFNIKNIGKVLLISGLPNMSYNLLLYKANGQKSLTYNIENHSNYSKIILPKNLTAGIYYLLLKNEIYKYKVQKILIN